MQHERFHVVERLYIALHRTYIVPDVELSLQRSDSAPERSTSLQLYLPRPTLYIPYTLPQVSECAMNVNTTNT